MTIKCSSVFLGVFALFFAFEANAGIFQFSETDPQYFQALSIAAAQEAQKEVDIEKKLELDENLKPEDFGLTDIGILPTSPFYFIKDIRRGVGSVFTRDPAKKAELKLKYASEKLLEAKEIAQKEGVSDKDKEHAIENFKDELKEVKHRIEIASESLDEEKSKELSKKVLDATFKYSKSLGNIEKNVSPELFDHVKGAKDVASEALVSTFGLTEPGIVSNQLTEVLDKQGGSEFKNFKNLEVLKEVEAKAPQEARDAIKNAQENAFNRLQAELEKVESAKKTIFEEFVKDIGGSEILHLEIINELEARPISKDLRNVILGAKEHIFSKAETRLNSLSQENKEKFVEHLGDGNLEDFRILKELQNNINSGVVSGISNVASRAEAEFVKKIESTGQSEAQKKEFLGSIARFHDAKSISVLNEIEQLIPDDKKSFFAELKSKAVQEIHNDVSRAANSSQRQHVYDSLAGDHPEDFIALDKFEGSVRAPFDISAFIEGIKKAQYGLMQDKIERISDKGRFSRYEEEFKNKEGLFRQEIPDYAKFRRVFQERKDIFESPEKALKKIEEAEKALAEFRGAKSSLPYDSAYKSGEFDQMLRDIEGILAHAERKLELARTVLGYNDIGRAFAEAQLAENIARDGIALAAKYKSGVKDQKCPFYFPPPQHFCQNGAIIHQTDQNGCPLPPRCEFRESRECPVVDYGAQTICPAGTHRETFKDERGCYILGKCIADKVICQAYFEGYVFDKATNSCKKESSGGCSDPFVYHTLAECTKAHTKINICPAMPTVTSCPAGEHKMVTFSSPECGVYYGCEKDVIITTPQCSDGKDNDGDGFVDYPADTGCYGKEDHDEIYYPPAEPYCRSYVTEATCKASSCVWYINHHDGTHCDDVKHGSAVSTSNWVEHIWKFKDGLTERSMILNHTDAEYLNFIHGIEISCLAITKDKFTWKTGAGNDAPGNWMNFGIPNCSGTATIPGLYEDSYALCSDGIDNDKDGFIDKADPSCSAFTTTIGSVCSGYTTSAICESIPACDWLGSSCVPTTTIASCNNNKICEVNESYTSCPTDCTGITARCIYFTEATCNADTICAWVAGFGCGSKAQCNDKVDNDGDGLIDMADNGCSDNFDNSESMGVTIITTQCSDGKDNDGDGQIDYPADKSCYDKMDNDEAYPATCVVASTCTSIESCSASGFYWHNGWCRESKPVDGTCPYSYNYCINETECFKNNYYWCRSTCYGDKSACPIITTTTTATTTPTYACSDGKDNDNDGLIDFPADPGCYSKEDKDETIPATTITTTGLYEDSYALCSDGIDNDKDGFIDKADPSCSAFTTIGTCPVGYYWTGTACAINTSPTTTTCPSGQYWNGTTCVVNTTTTITGLYEDSSALCSDGIDNDKDGFTDLADPSCASFTTTTVKPQCSDGIDNDGDAMIDYPLDTGCYSSTDNDEVMTTSSTGLYEDSQPLCSDGIDNDKDGFTDLADPSCASFTTTNTTSSVCITPPTCFDSAKCTASGWYWYNGMCNYSSQTTTTTTSCVSCPSPGTGCWYEGGSCSICGTIHCPTTTTTTTTTACNNNGVCDPGESTGTCPTDCHSTTTTTSCVACTPPSGGCWYEGGSCSTCGTLKCPTTTTTTSGASVLQSFWNRLLGF